MLDDDAGERLSQTLHLSDSRVLWWTLLGASIVLRLLFLANPFELHGVSDLHGMGERMLHGELPYRDFTFEYPPLAAPVVLLCGLVPKAWSATALAGLSLLAEIVVLALLRHDRVLVRRYLVMTLPLVPLLSGGFDSLVVLALVASILGMHRTPAAWAACAGALVKLFLELGSSSTDRRAAIRRPLP